MSPEAIGGEHHRRERVQALMGVFRVFAARWPRFFGGARADELVPVWLPAVAGLEAAQLEPIAIAYAAEAEGPAPAPAEFGRWARAYLRRVTGEDRRATAPEVPRDPADGARPFWYAKPGPEEGPYRLDAHHAVGLAVQQGPLAGGSLGICDADMDRLHRRELAGGWLAPTAVPAGAVPAGWHARQGVTPPLARSACA